MGKEKKKYQSTENLSTFHLTPAKRVYYALGDFGYNFMYYWLSTYLMIYYTDTIGISAATVSVMMLVVRIFDAFNDPIIGSLADRTNSRWGRYRPWFLIGAIAMATFIVLTFAASPDWSYTIRLMWMWGIYLLLTVASTCSNMPYGALNGCITPDSEDRAKVSGLRMMFANVSSMITVIIAVPLIRAFSTDGSVSNARGYFWAVLITCLLGIPTMIVCCMKTKEVVTPPPTQESIPLKAQMESLTKNKPVAILIVGQLILGCVIYGRAAMLAYYWQYNAGDAGYATTYGWVSLIAAIFGTGWLGNKLFSHLKHKGKVCAILNFITAVAYFLMYFVTAPSILFWILTFIGSMSFYAYMGIHFGAIGDAVDYGEYVSGVRCDGFLSAIVSVANKAGGAIMPAVGAAVLAAMNYVANGVQSTEVLNAINWFITLIPAIISAINGIFYLMYPISTEKHKEIMSELIRRRQ
ncbi:MAG: glycoside-pentoside-hexuronide (GPH):cation symporter [Lachnospiraceae bacterium]|nr:glycoside-pentoside-hexuronide (GPH):cation symporter [Lachnospiraceae bacterium]